MEDLKNDSTINVASQVYYVRFWMLHHGGSSSKRSVFYGNVSTMADLDKGKMSRSEKERQTKVKTTRPMT